MRQAYDTLPGLPPRQRLLVARGPPAGKIRVARSAVAQEFPAGTDPFAARIDAQEGKLRR